MIQLYIDDEQCCISITKLLAKAFLLGNIHFYKFFKKNLCYNHTKVNRQ